MPLLLPAQGFLEKITDLLEFDVGHHRPDDSTHFVPKIVLSPTAFYEPTTSLGLGIGAKLLFKPGQRDDATRTSNLPVGLSYTLNNQFIFNSGYTIFFPGEKWLLKGNLSYRSFPQGYYGVGGTTRERDRIDIDFNQFLIEPLLLRAIMPDVFVGGGFRINSVYNTRLEEETALLPAGYDLQDSLGSTSVGAEFAFTIDSRDNVLNASRGTLLEFTQGLYGNFLGGTNAFQLSKFDLRRYYTTPGGVFAFNVFGRYGWNDTPVQELSTLGGAELLRGYQEGRFRDRLAVFAQAEYRWQAWKRLGLVGFAGTGEVASGLPELNFKDLKYTVGGGLRILIIPSENLNLRIDYAFGLGRTSDRNFYLGIAEAF